MKTALPHRNTRAFTLTEVLIASFISVIALGATVAIAIQTLRTYATEKNKLVNNLSMRQLTDGLDLAGRYAEQVNGSPVARFAIFSSYANWGSYVTDQQTGSCVVFVSDPPHLTGGERLMTCFTVADNGKGENVIWKYTRTFTPSATPITSLGTAPTSWAKQTIVSGAVTNLNGTDTKIFKNSSDRAVVVGAEIKGQEMGTANQAAKNKLVYAISPRR